MQVAIITQLWKWTPWVEQGCGDASDWIPLLDQEAHKLVQITTRSHKVAQSWISESMLLGGVVTGVLLDIGEVNGEEVMGSINQLLSGDGRLE